MLFVCRVTEKHEFGASHPYAVSPTRAVRTRFVSHCLFPASEISMHHMTGVRLDPEGKLRNSTLNDNPPFIQHLRGLYEGIPHL